MFKSIKLKMVIWIAWEKTFFEETTMARVVLQFCVLLLQVRFTRFSVLWAVHKLCGQKCGNESLQISALLAKTLFLSESS